MMYFFYLPLFYFLNIHARTKTRAFSWVFIFLIPVGMLSYFTLNIDFDVYYFFVLTVMLYNVYEVGYIFNDCETTKTELKPTHRLSNKQLQYYGKYRYIIYSTRLFITISLLLFIFFVLDKSITTIIFLMAECFILSLVYYWYNSTRNRLNIFIGTILGTLRYSFVPVAIYFSTYDVFSYELIFISFLMFPLINVLTFLTKEKFKIYWAINLFVHHDKWRVAYYSVFSFFFFLFIFIDIQVVDILNNYQVTLVFLYYLVLRSIYLYVISRENFISKSVKYARGLQYFNKVRIDDK